LAITPEIITQRRVCIKTEATEPAPAPHPSLETVVPPLASPPRPAQASIVEGRIGKCPPPGRESVGVRRLAASSPARTATGSSQEWNAPSAPSRRRGGHSGASLTRVGQPSVPADSRNRQLGRNYVDGPALPTYWNRIGHWRGSSARTDPYFVGFRGYPAAAPGARAAVLPPHKRAWPVPPENSLPPHA
jgi:hypothetical protein